MQQGACSGCDLGSYVQVTKSSINISVQILMAFSPRSIISL